MNRYDFQEAMDCIKLSEQAKQKIIKNCIKERHVNNKVFLHSKQIAAALVIGILCTTSLTTYAAVSAYQAYMEKMSQEEVQERYDNIQEGNKERDSFSRELSVTERERMEQLLTEYQQGLRFPEKSMYCFDGSKEAVAGEKVTADNKYTAISYDYSNMIFYIPEHELTDEELLQIIDVWEKGNYSLGVVHREAEGVQGIGEGNETKVLTAEQVEVEMEKYKTDVTMTDEELIRQDATARLQALTENDLSGMEWEITLYGEHNPRYMVTVKNEADIHTLIYTTESTPDNLTFHRYTASHRSADETQVSENGYTKEQIMEKLPALAEDANEKFKACIDTDDRITKVEYGYDQRLLTGQAQHLMISLSTDEGERYKLVYNIESGCLREMERFVEGSYDKIIFEYDVMGSVE